MNGWIGLWLSKKKMTSIGSRRAWAAMPPAPVTVLLRDSNREVGDGSRIVKECKFKTVLLISF